MASCYFIGNADISEGQHVTVQIARWMAPGKLAVRTWPRKLLSVKHMQTPQRIAPRRRRCLDAVVQYAAVGSDGPQRHCCLVAEVPAALTFLADWQSAVSIMAPHARIQLMHRSPGDAAQSSCLHMRSPCAPKAGTPAQGGKHLHSGSMRSIIPFWIQALTPRWNFA